LVDSTQNQQSSNGVYPITDPLPQDDERLVAQYAIPGHTQRVLLASHYTALSAHPDCSERLLAWD